MSSESQTCKEAAPRNQSRAYVYLTASLPEQMVRFKLGIILHQSTRSFTLTEVFIFTSHLLEILGFLLERILRSSD